MLGMTCLLRCEIKQTLSLKKKCPHCGFSNDLAGPISINMMPFCHACKKPLWKHEGNYKNWYILRSASYDED